MQHNERYVPSAQRGIIHLSPVPRDMRPSEIQAHFNRFGEIRRMKFVPYPKKERWPGGPLLPLRFREGWMEFNEATNAQRAAETLNGQAVDVKRLRKCHGEMWVVKFMGKDFSWDSLIEEKEERRRLRRATEVQARRTERDANEAYRRLVLSSLSRSKKKKSASATEHDEPDGDNHDDSDHDATTNSTTLVSSTDAPGTTRSTAASRALKGSKRERTKKTDEGEAKREEEAALRGASTRPLKRRRQEDGEPKVAKKLKKKSKPQ